MENALSGSPDRVGTIFPNCGLKFAEGHVTVRLQTPKGRGNGTLSLADFEAGFSSIPEVPLELQNITVRQFGVTVPLQDKIPPLLAFNVAVAAFGFCNTKTSEVGQRSESRLSRGSYADGGALSRTAE